MHKEDLLVYVSSNTGMNFKALCLFIAVKDIPGITFSLGTDVVLASLVHHFESQQLLVVNMVKSDQGNKRLQEEEILSVCVCVIFL